MNSATVISPKILFDPLLANLKIRSTLAGVPRQDGATH
jgi:hypothetical protein